MQVFIAKDQWSGLRPLVFPYIINAEPSLGLSLHILLLPCVLEILLSWVLKTNPIATPHPCPMG